MRWTLPAAIVASFALLIGCSDDSKKRENLSPDPYLKQTSIENCLFNLKYAYGERNIEKFTALLGDQFTYVFDPQDVGGELAIPASWVKADEILSATNMFGGMVNRSGYQCDSISLSFRYGSDVASEHDLTWRKVVLSQIDLAVDSRHHESGDPLRYQAIGDRAELHFAETDEVDASSGKKIWKIVQWEDKPVGLMAATENTTWGRIKASWRGVPSSDPYLKQTSIQNCLFNLKYAYNQRNTAKFTALLHEQFMFVFAPEDVGGETEIPESWGMSDEIVSATNMFGGQANRSGYQCQSVSLAFVSGAEEQSPHEAAWRKVELSQVGLSVDTRSHDTGEPLRYQAIGDKADLHFVQTEETDPACGRRIWKIILWEDKPVGLMAATEPESWGIIKALWRQGTL